MNQALNYFDHGDGRQQAPGAAEAVSGVEKQEKITQKTTKNGQRRPLGYVWYCLCA